MRNPHSALLIVFAVIVLAADAFATATTHIWSPSTDVQPFNLWHVTSDLYVPVQNDKLPNHLEQRLPPVTMLGVTVGILPFEKVQMEVGLDHKSGYGTFDAYPMYANAKIDVPEKAFGKYFPAVAAGIFDVGTKSDMTNYDVLYGKAAYTIPVAGRISVGYFSGNKKLLLDSKGKKDNSGILVAWERTLSEWSDKWWVCVDYMGSKSLYGTLNVGFSYKTSDNVSVLVGYDIVNDKNLTGIENSITVQADIDLKLFQKK